VRESGSSEPSVVKEQGGYHLRSLEFGGITSDAHEVHARAQAALHLLIGLARLQRPDIRPVQILGIAREEPDRPPTQFLLPDPINVRLSLYRDLASGKCDGGLHGRLPVVLKDELVKKAIRLLGSQEPTWGTLRKVYDIVKGDVGGWEKIAGAGWATTEETKRFMSYASNPKASGDEAVHGYPDRDPEGPLMSVEEGGVLIRRLVVKWIDWKSEKSAGRPPSQ